MRLYHHAPVYTEENMLVMEVWKVAVKKVIEMMEQGEIERMALELVLQELVFAERKKMVLRFKEELGLDVDAIANFVKLPKTEIEKLLSE